MLTVDHIIHASWIVTCEEINRTLKDHALIIHQGLIKDVLPNKKAEEILFLTLHRWLKDFSEGVRPSV